MHSTNSTPALTITKATTFQARQPGFHDLWGHLWADVRSKYPEKDSVTLVKNEEDSLRGSSSSFCVYILLFTFNVFGIIRIAGHQSISDVRNEHVVRCDDEC